MTTPIPLTRGYVALVDDEDYERVITAGPWHPRPQPHTVYAQRNVRLPDGRRTTQALHRFITGHAGADHRNGDGLDNRRLNLRYATPAQQAMNRRLSRNSTSGYKGVSWSKHDSCWRAQIYITRANRRHLGSYRLAEDAARAYDAAARELFGEFARLNFPQETPVTSTECPDCGAPAGRWCRPWCAFAKDTAS